MKGGAGRGEEQRGRRGAMGVTGVSASAWVDGVCVPPLPLRVCVGGLGAWVGACLVGE